MAKVLFNSVSKIVSKDKDGVLGEDYKWSELEPDQQQALIEGWTLFLVMVLLPLLLLQPLIPDDDENKKWARAFSKLAEDISLGMNIGDLVRPIERPFPVLGKVLDMWDHGTSFFTEGLVRGEVDSRDLPKGFYPLFRTLPGGAAVHQWNSFMEDIENGERLLLR